MVSKARKNIMLYYLTFNVKYDDGAIIPSEIIDTAESLGCGR
jgi:hypothetical protein